MCYLSMLNEYAPASPFLGEAAAILNRCGKPPNVIVPC